MPKILIRIIVLLLVPCLVADPVTASAFSNSSTFLRGDITATSRFKEQALAAVPLDGPWKKILTNVPNPVHILNFEMTARHSGLFGFTGNHYDGTDDRFTRPSTAGEVTLGDISDAYLKENGRRVASGLYYLDEAKTQICPNFPAVITLILPDKKETSITIDPVQPSMRWRSIAFPRGTRIVNFKPVMSLSSIGLAPARSVIQDLQALRIPVRTSPVDGDRYVEPWEIPAADWAMNKMNDPIGGPVYSLDQVPVLTLRYPIKDLPPLSSTDFGKNSQGVYIGFVNEMPFPVAIKVFKDDYPLQEIEREIVFAQILGQVGTNPRFYGIVRLPNGKIGYVMQVARLLQNIATSDIYQKHKKQNDELHDRVEQTGLGLFDLGLRLSPEKFVISIDAGECGIRSSRRYAAYLEEHNAKPGNSTGSGSAAPDTTTTDNTIKEKHYPQQAPMNLLDEARLSGFLGGPARERKSHGKYGPSHRPAEASSAAAPDVSRTSQVDIILTEIEKIVRSGHSDKETLAQTYRKRQEIGLRLYLLQLKLLHLLGVLSKEYRLFSILSGIDLFPGFYVGKLMTYDDWVDEEEARAGFERIFEHAEEVLPRLDLVTLIPPKNDLAVIEHSQIDINEFPPEHIAKQVKANDVILLKFFSHYWWAPHGTRVQEGMKVLMKGRADVQQINNWIRQFMAALPAAVSLVILDKPSGSHHSDLAEYVLKTPLKSGHVIDALDPLLTPEQQRRWHQINETNWPLNSTRTDTAIAVPHVKPALALGGTLSVLKKVRAHESAALASSSASTAPPQERTGSGVAAPDEVARSGLLGPREGNHYNGQDDRFPRRYSWEPLPHQRSQRSAPKIKVDLEADIQDLLLASQKTSSSSHIALKPQEVAARLIELKKNVNALLFVLGGPWNVISDEEWASIAKEVFLGLLLKTDESSVTLGVLWNDAENGVISRAALNYGLSPSRFLDALALFRTLKEYSDHPSAARWMRPELYRALEERSDQAGQKIALQKLGEEVWVNLASPLTLHEARALAAREDSSSPPWEIFNQELRVATNKLLDTLPKRHARILKVRYLDQEGQHTFQETASRTFSKVTLTRLRQIEAKAFRMLRCPSRALLVGDFLPAVTGREVGLLQTASRPSMPRPYIEAARAAAAVGDVMTDLHYYYRKQPESDRVNQILIQIFYGTIEHFEDALRAFERIGPVSLTDHCFKLFQAFERLSSAGKASRALSQAA